MDGIGGLRCIGWSKMSGRVRRGYTMHQVSNQNINSKFM